MVAVRLWYASLILVTLWNTYQARIITNRQAKAGVPSKCECGQFRRKSRVVGGDEAEMNEYPWLVSLKLLGQHACGGALISSKHILTASHCFPGSTEKDLKNYEILLGCHNLENCDSEGQIRSIGKLYKHESFSAKTYDNDIAIVVLDKEVEFNAKMYPICIPTDDDEEFAERMATVAGWGLQSENGDTSDIPWKLDVPIWTRDACSSSDYGAKRITDNMFCAGYEGGGKDACTGDSGGPLFFKKDSNIHYTVGIVSWGRGCARPMLPGIYTKVTKYLKWISNILTESHICKPLKG